MKTTRLFFGFAIAVAAVMTTPAHAQSVVGPLQAQNLLSEIAAQGSTAEGTARTNLGLGTFSLNTSGTIKTSNATASTSTTTGAFVDAGGLGISGNTYLSSQTFVYGATLSDSRVSVFGAVPLSVGTAINANGSVFSVQTTTDTSFADAIIALGHLETAGAGGDTAPIYIECAQDAAGVCEGMEIDPFNSAGTVYQSLVEPNRGEGTTDVIPEGITLSAGSRTGYSGNSWAATDCESNTALWFVCHYINPAALMSNGYAIALGTLWNVAANGVETFTPGELAANSDPVISVQSYSPGSNAGGTIQLVNTGPGVPAPNKSLTVDSGGNLDIVNSAFISDIVTITDGGLLTAAGGLTTTATTASTSYTTGAIIDAGGFGLAGAMYSAGNVTLDGTTLTVNSTLQYPNLYTGTAHTYACFTTGGELISSSTAC